MSILEVLAEVTSRRADAIAVEDRTQGLTYAELDARACALAEQLIARGIGPDQLVGVCTRPSVETVIAMLGVLKSGGGFVALDVNYPAQRLAAMLADSATSLVVVDPACHGAHALGGIEQLVIGNTTAAPRATRVDPAQLAYVVFTSGSTGRPKGVAVTHAGIANLVARQIEAFELVPDSRVLQLASLGFDAVISEAFVTLGAGATLCLEPRTAATDIHEVLARRRITCVTVPPSLLRVLSPDDLPALRTVVSAGEPCTADIVARWAASRVLINAYGPSECTVCATMKRMTGPDDAPTIGRAIGGVDAEVVDAALAPVAQGEVGELMLGGPALARGYLGRAGLTAERFVPNPFAGAGAGARMYRTGDVVRLGADRELAYLERSDDQIKIRGYRVEPGEVEAALREVAGVDDVVVLPHRRRAGEVTLLAFVRARAGAIAVPALHAFAHHRLPVFLRPAEIIVIDAFPMSPNGKIDRAALARLRGNVTGAIPAAIPPATPTERAIERIVATVLELAAVDLDRSFFELGGDSIAAVRLAIALGAEFARALPIGLLFEAPTLRALAGRIDDRAASPPTSAGPVALHAGPATPRLWLLGPVHGNVLCYLRFASQLPDGLACSGLQAPGVDGERPPIDDFVALAAHQVAIIRAHQPRGPYMVGGWSMGGSLAFEMAVQLEQAGETVSHLVLIGSTAPSQDHLEAARATMARYEPWRMAYFYVRSLAFSLGLPPNDNAMSFDEWSQLADDDVLPRFIAAVRTLGPLGADLDGELAQRWLGVVRANLYGFQNQVPSGAFGGRTLMIRATGANPLTRDDLVRARAVPGGNWDGLLAGPVDTLAVGANHYMVMQPPWVDEIAAAVGNWLVTPKPS